MGETKYPRKAVAVQSSVFQPSWEWGLHGLWRERPAVWTALRRVRSAWHPQLPAGARTRTPALQVVAFSRDVQFAQGDT